MIIGDYVEEVGGMLGYIWNLMVIVCGNLWCKLECFISLLF